MRVIERIEGHYEAQEVEFGRVYRWTPETVVIACDCRERLLLTGFATTCKGCGADHTATFRDEAILRQPEDTVLKGFSYAFFETRKRYSRVALKEIRTMKLALDCWYELWNEAENRSLNSVWLPGTGASGEKTLVPRRPNKMASWRSAEALRSYEKSGGGSFAAG